MRITGKIISTSCTDNTHHIFWGMNVSAMSRTMVIWQICTAALLFGNLYPKPQHFSIIKW